MIRELSVFKSGLSRRGLAAALLLLPQAGSSQRVSRPVDLIQPADLKADIYFLASDEMAGRSLASPEDRIATDYIAAEFMRLGLKPMGKNGSYFQELQVLSGEPDRERLALSAKIGETEHSFTLDKDFRLTRQSLRSTKACGAVAFAGYGIDAPEYGYDDLSGVDVKGKIVLVFNREPQANDAGSRFMGALDTYHAFFWEKIELLRKQGVAGVLLIEDRPPREVKPIPASSPRAAGGPSYALAGEMWDVPVFTVKREVADQLLAPGGKTADELQAKIDAELHPHSFEVARSSVCMTKAYTGVETRPGRNVVALLEGSDPRLRAQAILVTAHHDHMGVAGGHIFHGADDNASGVAGMLEVARAMVKGKVRPKRSVLFIAFDGEERVFLGSYFYVTHPLVPLGQTAAIFNLDMIGRDENDANWPLPADRNANMVNVLGTRYNPGLRRAIDRQNERQTLKLDYKMDTIDPDSLWSRSDHFWFAARHIPQVEFQTGLHEDYHTDHDTWDRINYPKLTRIARLVFLSVADLANSPQSIAFVPAGAPVALKR